MEERLLDLCGLGTVLLRTLYTLLSSDKVSDISQLADACIMARGCDVLICMVEFILAWKCKQSYQRYPSVC